MFIVLIVYNYLHISIFDNINISYFSCCRNAFLTKYSCLRNEFG